MKDVFIYQKKCRDSAQGGAQIGEELVSGTGAVLTRAGDNVQDGTAG